MYCTMCEHNKKLRKEKVAAFKYTACGLNNIVLYGVELYRCPSCGEEYFSFGNMNQLHDLIAKILINQKRPLSGAEIRFLRKHIGLSTSQFARKIKQSRENVIRVEKDQHYSATVDVIVRLLIAIKYEDRNYELHDELDRKEKATLKFEFKRNEWLPKDAA